MNIGVVGCGAIGKEIALGISNGLVPGMELVGVCDSNEFRARQLLERIGPDIALLPLDSLVSASDLVFEATSKSAMPEVASKALGAGKDILIMSVGGLVERPDLLQLAEIKGANIYCPSGAICGIDGILAAREAGLDKVQITTTKHPRSLEGAPYLNRMGISLEELGEPKAIFEGSAREAIECFPSNVNVAVTLSLAGVGVDQTQVRIIADPNCQRTKHEIVAEGYFGTIRSVTEGITAPGNPRTGYLAILSALAALRRIGSSAHIGT